MKLRHIFLPTTKLLILSDLHLNKANPAAKHRLLRRLRKKDFDTVLITGDTSDAGRIIFHLLEICNACGDRPVICVTGNHDYFGSSLAEVDMAIDALTTVRKNLVVLGQGEIIELSESTALIGHRGWYDGLSGLGSSTPVGSPDRFSIQDFRKLSRYEFFDKLRLLGLESADYFRCLLPRALKNYQNVLIGTHVPPFSQGVRFSGKGCLWNVQPYFMNRSVGNLIWGISKRFPHRRIQVHAGHTHSPVSVTIRPNLFLEVSGATLRMPGGGKLLTIP